MSDLQEAIYRTVKLACAEAERKERERIIAILKWEHDHWTRQASFSYRMALAGLIEKIKND